MQTKTGIIILTAVLICSATCKKSLVKPDFRDIKKIEKLNPDIAKSGDMQIIMSQLKTSALRGVYRVFISNSFSPVEAYKKTREFYNSGVDGLRKDRVRSKK